MNQPHRQCCSQMSAQSHQSQQPPDANPLQRHGQHRICLGLQSTDAENITEHILVTLQNGKL